jgi:phosphohistidine phosphatase SixA
MEIILVRHGVQSRDGAGHLSQHGVHQIDSLAVALERRGVRPTLVLTSRSSHAHDTAALLRDRLGIQVIPIVALNALTPDGGPSELDVLLSELEKAGITVADESVVFIVGHVGRLSNLLTELTGSRARPIAHGEAVMVWAGDMHEVLRGRAQVHSRYPVFDHDEKELRAKVQSKMTVASFLAGFVFTALSTLLLDLHDWPWHRVLAATALTGSLCLLVASVYVFDQLGTPSGFWTDNRSPWLWRRFYVLLERRAEKRWDRLSKKHGPEAADEDVAPMRLDGPVYRLMLRTTRFVFNPAVLLGLIGFVALLTGTANIWVIVLGCSALFTAVVYVAWRRPNLGAD